MKNIQIIDADWLDLEEGDPINLKYFVVSSSRRVAPSHRLG
jgi:hypothetical protein